MVEVMKPQDKHSTHSLSFIECVVASNKLASARKAHVEMPKLERFRWRKEGKESARRPEDPQFCHEVNACCPKACVWAPSSLPKLAPVLAIIFLIHWWIYPLRCGISCWLCPACIHLNTCVHACKPLFKDGGAARKLSELCSSGFVESSSWPWSWWERQVSSYSFLLLTSGS